MLPVVVLCGGRGTRLQSITGAETAKAMVLVNDRPFIDYKLASIADAGLRDAVLAIGHGGGDIRDHVGDGSQFGLQVRYSEDGGRLLGTGGAVNAARRDIEGSFWVTYGDSLVTVDVGGAEAAFEAARCLGLMTVIRGEEHGAANALVTGDRVVAYGKDPAPIGAEHIDYGMLILTQEAFATMPDGSFDLTVVLADLARAGRLSAFEVDVPFYEVGTPEALRATERYLRSSTPRTQ